MNYHYAIHPGDGQGCILCLLEAGQLRVQELTEAMASAPGAGQE